MYNENIFLCFFNLLKFILDIYVFLIVIVFYFDLFDIALLIFFDLISVGVHQLFHIRVHNLRAKCHHKNF